ncbi:MAG TPA: hypothetical protein VE760_02430, partial [Acidimicrobiales bacterium]|nr:hypothetical protein [Acidimicrobiales bacterium]
MDLEARAHGLHPDDDTAHGERRAHLGDGGLGVVGARGHEHQPGGDAAAEGKGGRGRRRTGSGHHQHVEAADVGLVRRRRGWVVTATSAAVALFAALPVVAPPPLEGTQVAPGARLWRRG